FGGIGGSSREVEGYNPATNSWSTKASMPTPRQNPAAALGVDGLIYVFGGNNSKIVATVEAYNPASNSWATKANIPTNRTELAAATGADGLIYVMGGFRYLDVFHSVVLATVEAYAPAGPSASSSSALPVADPAVQTTTA